MSRSRDEWRAQIDAWTQEDRETVLRELLSVRPGVVPLGDPRDGAGILFLGASSDRQLAPGARESFSAVVQAGWFKPQRMVILEPLVERTVEEEYVEEFEVYDQPNLLWRPWRFWLPRYFKDSRFKKSETRPRRVVREQLPRAGWRVHGVYVGPNAQFHGQASLYGEVFGPEQDGKFDFDGSVLLPGVSFSVSVSHEFQVPASFVAGIVGRDLSAAEIAEERARRGW